MVYLCKIYRQKRTVMKKFGMVIAIGREVKGVLEAFGKVEKIENKPYDTYLVSRENALIYVVFRD